MLQHATCCKHPFQVHGYDSQPSDRRYIPSVTLIDDVFRNNAVPLLVTGFTATVCWVIFATMLWMAEHGDSVVTGDNGITQGQRFQDVPTALQYTLILLSGDYPLCDFVFWGQVGWYLQSSCWKEIRRDVLYRPILSPWYSQH